MKIYRNDELAVLYRSFRFARRNTLAIGMLGLFPFGRSELGGLRPEPELWQAVQAQMGAVVLDEGYPKPAAEFLVYGQAHAPAGQPVGEMQVSATLAGVGKSLLVSGERHFNALGLISAPLPFMTMPLTPACSFGGATVPANPAGKGAQAVRQADGSEQWPLPNVERQRQRVLSHGDQAEPAGFWALDAGAPARTALLGRFDESWRKATWPHLPDDTRTEYFHVAPPDQRFPGYLQGNESFELRGMHAGVAQLSGRLPGLRARCFVNRRHAGGVERFSELQARLETVWLFPELACGIVLYRALSEVADEDASDALHVMAEWEPLGEAALDFDHYEGLFRRRLLEEAGGAEKVESALDEPTAPAAPAAVAAIPALAVPAALAVNAPDIAQAHLALDQMEAQTLALLRRHGIDPADLKAWMTPPSEPPAVTLAEAERAVDQLEQQTREIMRQNNLSEADVVKLMHTEPESPVTLTEVKARLQALDQQTHALMQKNNLSEQDVQDFLASRPETAEAARNLAQAKAGDVPLSAIPDVAPVLPGMTLPAVEPGMLAAAAMALPLPALARTGAKPAQLTREQVIERHAAGQSLSGYDLSGVDLSRLDLGGADLSGSVLEATLLAGSRLAGARLSGCLMQGADCSEADFSGADLAQASAAGSKFAKARLSGAQLKDADFTAADFSAAQLQQAVLDDALFERATMAGLQAAGVHAVRGNFSGADLSGADFSQAVLTQAMLNDCKLAAASFKAARCEQAEFYGVDASAAQFTAARLDASRADASSQFAQAVFDGAQLPRAAWEGVQLAGASFADANLDDADLSQARAPGAIFRRASARHARFSNADLSRADLSGANLFKGSLRKTRVEEAVLHGCNAYGVDFEGTTIRAAALEGADTGQTILSFRVPLA